LRRNPKEKKKRQKKSIFIYDTTFKKNESDRDFQRVQIWNDRSQKQKKNYGSHPFLDWYIVFFVFSLNFLGTLGAESWEPAEDKTVPIDCFSFFR
jgi:hypothetical protein